MSENHKEMLQKVATTVWELRAEHDRATEDRRRAEDRVDTLGARLREAEAELCKTVGAKIPTKMWLVATGVAVIAHHRAPLMQYVTIHEAEPQS